MLKILVLSIITVMLSGCGGGGNPDATNQNCVSVSSNPALNGVCMAVLNTTNANGFVADTITATLLSMSMSFGPTMSITEPVPTGTLQAQSNGCNGGNIKLQFDALSDSFNTTGTYAGYDDCIGFTVSGSANLLGRFTQVVTTAPSTARIDMITMPITTLLFTNLNTGQNMTFSGIANLTWRPSISGSAEYVFEMSQGTFFNSLGNVMFDVAHLTIDSKHSAGQQSVLINGIVIRPGEGYVRVSSDSRLTMPTPGYSPQTGTFIMEGDSENALVTYTGGTFSVIINPL